MQGKQQSFHRKEQAKSEIKTIPKNVRVCLLGTEGSQKKENLLQMILSFLGLYGVFTFGETHACLKLLGTFNICQTYCSHGLVTLRTFKHWVSLYLPTIS